MKVNMDNRVSQSYGNPYKTASNEMFSKILNNKNSESDQDSLTYYYQLCQEFPDITFRLGDQNEGLKNINQPYLGYRGHMNQVGNNFGKMGQCSISLDISVIRKMQTDPSYEEEVKGMIQNSKEWYAQTQQDALEQGYSSTAVYFDDTKGRLQRSVMQTNMQFSTEDEINKMWKQDVFSQKMQIKFNRTNDKLLDTYLQMLEEADKKVSMIVKVKQK